MTAPQFLQWFASYSLQAAMVIGFAVGLDRWSAAATTKSRVWTACFLSLLGLLAAGLLLPHAQWSAPWASAPKTAVLAAVEAQQDIGALVLRVWLFGVGVMVARLVVNFVRVQRFIKRQPPVAAEVDRHLRGLVEPETLFAAGKQVEFRIGPEEIGPFCYQFHRPLVFLPASLLACDPEELRHVLGHELTHLRTEHPMQLCLQKAVQCVLWFHPLVWMASGRASLVREFVCDDAASNDGAATAAYLRTLLVIVERQRRFSRSSLTLGRSVSEVRIRAARLVARCDGAGRPHRIPVVTATLAAASVAWFLWLPTDPLTSARSTYSPWPTWSAAALHAFDLPATDFPPFDARTLPHELGEASTGMDD